MAKNQGVFQILSPIAFETVKSQRQQRQKKYDFVTIFFIFKFRNLEIGFTLRQGNSVARKFCRVFFNNF